MTTKQQYTNFEELLDNDIGRVDEQLSDELTSSMMGNGRIRLRIGHPNGHAKNLIAAALPYDVDKYTERNRRLTSGESLTVKEFFDVFSSADQNSYVKNGMIYMNNRNVVDIVVNDKSLLLPENRKELEAVVAHEIGHEGNATKSLIQKIIYKSSFFIPIITFFGTFTYFYKRRKDDTRKERLKAFGKSLLLAITSFMVTMFISNRMQMVEEYKADEFAFKTGRGEGIVKFLKKADEEEFKGVDNIERVGRKYIEPLITKTNHPTHLSRIEAYEKFKTNHISESISFLFENELKSVSWFDMIMDRLEKYITLILNWVNHFFKSK